MHVLSGLLRLGALAVAMQCAARMLMCCPPPLLQVLLSSMASFTSIVILLVLFWLVFSIVGLHVFGGLTLDVPWPNCDTFVNSLILNFNVRAAA
jgi:hypothetical protein